MISIPSKQHQFLSWHLTQSNDRRDHRCQLHCHHQVAEHARVLFGGGMCPAWNTSTTTHIGDKVIFIIQIHAHMVVSAQLCSV